MRPILKTKKLIYQSKANLDVKIVFSNIIYFIGQEIRKMLEEVCVGTNIPHSIPWSMIYLLFKIHL